MIKKILVSQPQPSNDKSPYYDIAKEFGVEFIFRPFFKVEGLTAKEFRQQKINLLDYTAVVFTSRHAIDNYFKLAKEMRINISASLKPLRSTSRNTFNIANAKCSLELPESSTISFPQW